MPRIKLYHKVSVTLPDGKVKHTNSIGCKPYALITRRIVDKRATAWKVANWCSTYDQAMALYQKALGQREWLHEQTEATVRNTSCHIATGRDAEENQ